MTLMNVPRFPRFMACLGGVIGIAVVAACAPPKRSACAGLTYKDYGLSREEYAPCAKSMVQQLDRMHQALVVLGDADKPKSDRARARQSCFAASSALAQQMREAGGTEKLVSIPWADSTLSRFNYEVEATHKAYLMYCYYGLTGPEVMRMEAGHEMAHSIAKALP